MAKIDEEQTNLLIAGQLKKFRISKNLSQEELGAVIGVSNQQYSKFETGKNRIFAGQLFLIAQEFDLDLNCFFANVEF